MMSSFSSFLIAKTSMSSFCFLHSSCFASSFCWRSEIMRSREARYGPRMGSMARTFNWGHQTRPLASTYHLWRSWLAGQAATSSYNDPPTPLWTSSPETLSWSQHPANKKSPDSQITISTKSNIYIFILIVRICVILSGHDAGVSCVRKC